MKNNFLALAALLAFCPFASAATKANVYVTAQLQGFTMSLSVTDIQMTGKSGGTLRNSTVEMGALTTLTNGILATAPEILKVDFEPGNNLFSIQVYLSNSGEGYNAGKFKGNTESAYWDLGSEANGLIGTNNHDYVAPLLWSCRDNNMNINCNTNSISTGAWGYLKDKYTHIGENASGILLATNAFAAGVLEGKTNGALITTAGHRPMETWMWTWEQDGSRALSDPLHWKKGVDAAGYRKICYGTGGQYYSITMPSYDETTPLTDKTVYVAVAGDFGGKPAQVYRTRKMYLEIVAD